MSQASSASPERIVASFVSLLSSALTKDGAQGAEPLKDSSATLPRLLSRSISQRSECCVVPTLLLKQKDSPSHQGASLQEVAALNLARTMALTRAELEFVPGILLRNLTETFTSLIDSRLRSSLVALAKNSEKQRNPTLTRVIVGLLACANNPITPTTVVTSFRALNGVDYTKNSGVIMPITMEVVIDLRMFGELITVSFFAPGTIQVSFGDVGIASSELVVDTVSLLQEMMMQARWAVRKAIGFSSKIAGKLLLPTASISSSDWKASTVGPKQTSPMEASSSDNGAGLMPPPPPRRASSRHSVKILDSPSSTGGLRTISRNDDWTQKKTNPAGLSMLTETLGIKRGRSEESSEKSQKRRVNESMFRSSVKPKKVTSCPTLEPN